MLNIKIVEYDVEIFNRLIFPSSSLILEVSYVPIKTNTRDWNRFTRQIDYKSKNKQWTSWSGGEYIAGSVPI